MTRGHAAVTAYHGAPTASVRWVSPRTTHRIPDPGRWLSRRSRCATDTAWALVESVLASRGLSNFIAVATTFAGAALFLRRYGFDGLIVNLPSLAVIWSAAYGLVGLGRRRRGVRPQLHAPRRPVLPAISWQKSVSR
jgi:hypothetical protein